MCDLAKGSQRSPHKTSNDLNALIQAHPEFGNLPKLKISECDPMPSQPPPSCHKKWLLGVPKIPQHKNLFIFAGIGVFGVLMTRGANLR
jgi:hypothetical protein